MLQLLPQKEILTPNINNPHKASELINSYIDKYHCPEIEIDISNMNIPDACYVSTVCAAKHFTKYTDGKINWKVSSRLVEEFTANLNLGNNYYSLI